MLILAWNSHTAYVSLSVSGTFISCREDFRIKRVVYSNNQRSVVNFQQQQSEIGGKSEIGKNFWDRGRGHGHETFWHRGHGHATFWHRGHGRGHGHEFFYYKIFVLAKKSAEIYRHTLYRDDQVKVCHYFHHSKVLHYNLVYQRKWLWIDRCFLSLMKISANSNFASDFIHVSDILIAEDSFSSSPNDFWRIVS